MFFNLINNFEFEYEYRVKLNIQLKNFTVCNNCTKIDFEEKY